MPNAGKHRISDLQKEQPDSPETEQKELENLGAKAYQELYKDPGPPAKPRKNLVQKLAEVMKEVGYVPKKGWNDYHKYEYVREADLCDAIREKLAERNIMLITNVLSEKHETLTHGNKPTVLTTVEVEYAFIDGDVPTDNQESNCIKFRMVGSGSDATDKGAYKAITGATKYALMKTFLVPTGDDPEEEKPEKEKTAKFSKAAPEEQATTIAERASKVDPDLPSKEEKAKYAEKLRSYPEKLHQPLRSYVLSAAGVKKTSEITRTKWVEILNKLDTAYSVGEAELTFLVTGEKSLEAKDGN